MRTNPALTPRAWLPPHVAARVNELSHRTADSSAETIDRWVHDLAAENRDIHERQCINLNPATNTMNPRAEAMLASGIGARPSLGYPGDKYEMGLEAIEQIEVIAAELAAEVFGAQFAEIRMASGAMANLYAFMSAAKPGDPVIVPPPTIGGHVTHNRAGAAGLYGLDIHEAPIDAGRYTVDVEALAQQAKRIRPKVISLGGSLNLTHHPVEAVREIADDVGAILLFDAAHLSGPIAGGAWPNPLEQGAHVLTMSTYKSLGGPPAGLLLTNDASIAERIEAIAYPGLTANFDAAKSAALAITLLDWKSHGTEYAQEMVRCADALATALVERDVPVFLGGTQSHAFAVDTGDRGGHETAKHLRSSNLLTCAIGLPHDENAGLRIGTNEIVRWGATAHEMAELAEIIAGAIQGPLGATAAASTRWRQRFDDLRFIRHRADETLLRPKSHPS